MNDLLIAQNRFGLGACPSTHISGAPKVWLRDQFGRYQAKPGGMETLATATEIAQDLSDTQMQARAAAKEKKGDAQGVPGQSELPARQMSPGETVDMAAAKEASPKKEAQAEFRAFSRDQYVAQIGIRVRNAVVSNTPFVERLVHFWANHFAVSADKMTAIAFAGLLEFEAIRPHVLGRFEDMLVAVEQHPAMLLYLDQAQSVGPDSIVGARAEAAGRKAGLNENLGREILELHTLGVRTGYSQDDVTEFARALTGWTVAGIGRGRVGPKVMGNRQPGQFLFAEPLHEPGARTIMGKHYGQSGEAQARAVLADLARHPATARHLATKLARHFVADDPPEPLVARLEQAYLKSHGDLPTVYRALIDAPEAWAPMPAKFRTPWQWSIALLRSLYDGSQAPLATVQDKALAGMFVELGQPVWKPGSPAGYDDVAESWAAPDSLYRRVELAGRFAGRAPATIDPRALAERLLGTGLSPATAQVIAGAGSPKEGLSLLFVSPEMLRS
jgi:uncharacterized protein (DUF1800 family)